MSEKNTHLCILDNNKPSFDFMKWKQNDKLRILRYSIATVDTRDPSGLLG